MAKGGIVSWIMALVCPLLVAAGGVAGVIWVLPGPVPPGHLDLRLPGGDGRPKRSTPVESGPVTGTLETLTGKPSMVTGQWPRFRGAELDDISTDDTPIAQSWPATGLPELWSIEVGEGYAGAAIWQGRVYVMDYDRKAQANVVRCLSLDDGKDIWRYSFPVKIKRWHGMSRTVPTIAPPYVVSMGPKCHVTCLNAVSGHCYWLRDLVHDYHTTIPQWYTAQCPLVEDGKAILAPGGDALMIAVDCNSGDVVWKTPNPDGWVMTHSSIVPMTFAGQHFYVYCGGSTARGGVVGISARDGSVLWRYDGWHVRTNVPLPVVVGEDRLLLTAGYGQTQYGCAMLKLTNEKGRIVPVLQYEHGTEVFGSLQQTPICYEDHLYGVGMDNQLTCLDLAGKVLWKSGSSETFGYGPYMIADGLLLLLDDHGRLTLARTGAQGYQALTHTQVFKNGIECWGPMALASGRLIVRDLTRMKCLDLRESSQAK